MLVRQAPRLRGALWRGLAFGFGFYLAGIHWVAIAFLTDIERFGPYAIPAVLLLALGMGLFVAAAAGLVWLARLRSPVAAALFLAVAWTASEVARDFLTDFPWNPLGSVWAVSPLTMQPAAWVGVYGLSLLTVAAFALPAVWLEQGRRRPILLGLAIFAAVFAAATLRLTGPGPGDVEGVRLRLLQANVAQQHKWDPELRERWFARHLELAQAPGAGAPPTHVIWPETAAPYLLDEDVVARTRIAEATPAGGGTVTGAERFDFSTEPGRAWNSLFAIDSRAAVAARYDKVDLVPFGEFLPLRPVLGALGLTNLAGGIGDFERGPGRATLDVAGLPPFSPLICYEVIFTGRVVAPGARPGFLLNVTNDAWFGTSAGPFQHLAMARLRTVEEGLPLVRAANSGISVVIDARGRTVERLGLNEAGFLDAALPAALQPPPLYARIGWIAPAALALVMLVMAVAGEARARRDARQAGSGLSS